MIKLDPELKVPEMLQALVQHYDPAPVLDIQPLALGMLV
jgi:hypothetical protein